jgi:2'-hydroxyisoflavone reductase
VRLLVLGGTVFLGRHVVASALARGHAVTLFNRGRAAPELFPEAEHLVGNRDGGLHALRSGRWDAAIDCSGYLPRVVGDSARLLADAVAHMTFVSSVSVYADVGAPGLDETAAVATLQDETVEEITGETYGPLKALCEQAVEEAFPGRSLILRPGLIVGPHDPTDRFTYWPARIAEGGEVLAPGDPSAAAQWIDVRDLAGWMVDMSERGATGVMNAVGPAEPTGLGELLEVCVDEVAPPGTSLVWIEDSLLLEHGLEPWVDLPLWLGGDPTLGGLEQVSGERALRAGLRLRSAADTVRDTLAWHRGGGRAARRAGFKLDRTRETELLLLAGTR